MSYASQRGVGLIEVLVALVILAIGILGFAALQLKALDAAQQATEQNIAMNTARDLAERMRVNRTALSDYKTAINKKTTTDTCHGVTDITTPKSLAIPKCNTAIFALQDVGEVLTKASENGQTIVVDKCVKSQLDCIYVAWGKTEIRANDLSACIDPKTGTYVVDSKCLVLEAF